MIARQWRGIVRRQHVENYIEHLREETFPSLSGIEGFVDVSLMKRATDSGVEFLVLTRWESMQAIERFAGRDVTVAVVPERVRAWMESFDPRVQHYEIL